MRPLRITSKRVVISTLALEEFLTEFNDDIVDAIETVRAYAYEQKASENLEWENDGAVDENDHVGNALIDIEMSLETLRDMFSPSSRVPQGGRHASQVFIGKRAGTITIARRTSREDLEYQAARDMAAELLEHAPEPPSAPVSYRPRLPDEDDLEPVFAELLEERYAVN